MMIFSSHKLTERVGSVGSGFVVDKEFSKSNCLTYFSIKKKENRGNTIQSF